MARRFYDPHARREAKVPYVPVGAVPGRAQTLMTRAATRAAIVRGAAATGAAMRAQAAKANKAKATVEGRSVFVPSVKLTVAGNVEDLRGARGSAPKRRQGRSQRGR